jgi:hypothetical protein
MGTGGFDWFRQWFNAATALEDHLDSGPGFDLRFSMVDAGDLTDDEITVWLDKHPELWDVPAQP